jgi:predicted TPR repeat methyltransferase
VGFTFHIRFQHSLSYIRTLAAISGLAEITAQPCPLRDDVPPGWLVVLQKPAQ